MIVPVMRSLLVATLLALPLAAANDATLNSQSPNVPKAHNEATVAVALASCRLSRGRLALGAAGEDARRTAAGTAALLSG